MIVYLVAKLLCSSSRDAGYTGTPVPQECFYGDQVILKKQEVNWLQE